jgi:hypothetical protein
VENPVEASAHQEHDVGVLLQAEACTCTLCPCLLSRSGGSDKP